jgi:mannose-6-phosphate isomerase-like protein (cupin superfamily)
MNPREPERLLEVRPEEFTQTIEEFEHDGYRLLMIKPADAPREAVLRKPDREEGLNIRLKSTSREDSLALPHGQASASVGWVVGRAGMMYRDLIPDRLGGKLIASHIRIVDGGDVADRVHYHKIDFQVIYCLKGAIRVVYEDQGEPFRLRPGDCVLQPPEIRHRVLEAETGSEVIELTSPADHETWFDHEMELPTERVRPDRQYGGQRFVLHCETSAVYQQTDLNETFETRTGITEAGPTLPDVMTLTSTDRKEELIDYDDRLQQITIVIDGRGLRIKS